MSSPLVPALVLASSLIFVTCDYIFLLCFTITIKPHTDVSGYIYLGCWDEACSVKMMGIGFQQNLTIRPFETIQETTEVYETDYEETFPSVRLMSKQKITVTAGTWDGRVFFFDAFTAYPVVATDTKFLFGVLRGGTTFLLLISAYNETEVDIRSIDNRFRETVSSTRFVTLYSYMAHRHNFNTDLSNGTGVYLVGENMFAVYTCDDVVKASVRPMIDGPVHYFITGTTPIMRNLYNIIITTVVGTSGRVHLTNEMGDSETLPMPLLMESVTDLPVTLKLQYTFRTLLLASNLPLSIAVSYEGVLNDKDTLSHVMEMRDMRACYVLSVPFDNHELRRNTRMLTLIAKKADVNSIMVNRVSVRQWFVEGQTLDFKGLGYTAGNIVHNQTLAFTTYNGTKVKFGVYMFGESRAGLYHTVATGFNSFTSAIYKRKPAPPGPDGTTEMTIFVTMRCATCFGGANRSLFADWMIFGVFMPTSLSLLILSLYAIKVYRRPPPLAESDNEEADEVEILIGGFFAYGSPKLNKHKNIYASTEIN